MPEKQFQKAGLFVSGRERESRLTRVIPVGSGEWGVTYRIRRNATPQSSGLRMDVFRATLGL
jgi:hypothetical protein